MQRSREEFLEAYCYHFSRAKVERFETLGLTVIEERGEGCWIWDQNGNKYFDCRDGAGTFNLGHSPKRVRERVIEGLRARKDIGNNLFFSREKVLLAESLARISPLGLLPCASFGASGGEIVDFSVKLARAHTGRTGVIAMKKGYHGCTGFALAASAESAYRDPYGPLVPGFSHVPFGESAAVAQAISGDTACVIVEPVQGEGGINVPPAGYLRELREICTRAGVLLICDEIQTGLGRTGRMFGVDHEGVVPDILLLGKALSGGLYPITAALYGEGLRETLDQYPFSHFSTFGGADLGCLAALETIRTLQLEELPSHAETMGALFEQGFGLFAKRYPGVVKEFRRKGLMMALELTGPEHGPQVVPQLKERGILASFLQHSPHIIRLLPPLVVQPDEVSFVVNGFDGALNALELEGAGRAAA